MHARLRESRARATRACDMSRLLCERATTEVTRSRALRTISSDQARCWRGWHRLWRRVVLRTVLPTDGIVPMQRPRAFVRSCMYCARVYVALPLARGLDEADTAWRAVPPWVRQRIADPNFRMVLSHGVCPTCASRYTDHW